MSKESRLRRREVDGTIPQIPEICADVFGSSVRPRLMELCISKDDHLIPGTARIKRRPIATKASKARLGFPTAAVGHRRLGVTTRA